MITPLWTRDACVMSCDRRGCQQHIEAATADEARRSDVDMWERGRRMGWW